jgi:hypothetical protein
MILTLFSHRQSHHFPFVHAMLKMHNPERYNPFTNIFEQGSIGSFTNFP